jgi:hypothetical protein
MGIALLFTLHGDNIHCQQRELSKFLMRYQQFASHAVGPVSKMASQQEKASCVLRFEVSRSVNAVQLEIRALFRKDAPHKNSWLRSRGPGSIPGSTRFYLK